MAFDAATLQYVENALSDCFQYHNNLDQFLMRSGVQAETLRAARLAAEERSASSHRAYSRAPKRFVVQEVLQILSETGDAGDRIVASIIDALLAGAFSEATTTALEAISSLRQKRENDVLEQRRRRQEEEAKKAEAKKQESERRTRELLAVEAKRASLKDRFISLMGQADPQSRGYALEKLLEDLFEVEGLNPRGSFKLVGEQIDGSFSWREQTFLVEAKWVKSPIAGADFGQFIFKIDGKTANTRGVYISINGYSPEAIRGLNSKGALKFICLDGAHLMRVLSGGERLPELLSKLWRHADETGESYLPSARLG